MKTGMKQKVKEWVSNKQILGILVILSIAIILLIVLLLVPSKAQPLLGFPNQVIDTLSIENIKIIPGESSTYTADVTNISETTKNLSVIEIQLEREDGKSISMYGYIGENLPSKETRQLTASIDQDLSDVKSIWYVIH